MSRLTTQTSIKDFLVATMMFNNVVAGRAINFHLINFQTVFILLFTRRFSSNVHVETRLLSLNLDCLT